MRLVLNMTDREQTLFNFREDCRKALVVAFEAYDIDYDASDVDIMTTIRGAVAGKATRRNHVYAINFNIEAVLNHYDDMVKNTVPHEIAHIICMMEPHLGCGHNDGWKRVCGVLGGDDSRTHDMVLTPGRNVKTFEYIVNGTPIKVGAIRHKKIQGGYTGYVMTSNRVNITRLMWTGMHLPDCAAAHSAKKLTVKAQKVKSPTKSTKISKMDLARGIMDANMSLTRKELIEMLIFEAELTPAGAATYYYKIKKGG